MPKRKDFKLTVEQRDFAEENHNLIYGFLNKYGYEEEEHYGMASIGFCKAVHSFDKSKNNAFSSYAYACMYNEIRKYKRAEQISKSKIPEEKIESYNVPLPNDDTFNRLESDERLSTIDYEYDEIDKHDFYEKVVKFIGDNFDERTLDVILMISQGYSYEIIGEKHGVKRQRIGQIVNDIRKKCKNQFGENALDGIMKC